MSESEFVRVYVSEDDPGDNGKGLGEVIITKGCTFPRESEDGGMMARPTITAARTGHGPDVIALLPRPRLEPFAEESIANGLLGVEDGNWERTLRHWGALWLSTDDKLTCQTLVSHLHQHAGSQRLITRGYLPSPMDWPCIGVSERVGA